MASIPSTGDAVSEATFKPLATPPVSLTEQAWNHDAILKMTAEVFPGARIEFGIGADPEIEDDEYFVVSVVAPGEVAELVARDGQWHRRLRMIAGDTTRFYRLSLEVA